MRLGAGAKEANVAGRCHIEVFKQEGTWEAAAAAAPMLSSALVDPQVSSPCAGEPRWYGT